jgi:MFS family permease
MSEKNHDLLKPKESSFSKERYIRGISLNVLLMGLVSLFTDVSSEMITAVMPFFILSLSGGTILAIGLIDGVSNAVANIIKGFSGWISDKLKRRKAFVIAGYSVSNIVKPFIGAQSQWVAVLGLKITDRIGKGIRTAPRDALISYYADKSVLDLQSAKSLAGRNFGIHRSMDTTGAVLGPLLASLLLILHFSYGQVIIWSILPGIIAIIIVCIVRDVKEDEILALKSKKSSIEENASTSKNKSQTREKLSPQLIKLIVILSAMEFASVDVAFVMVRATDMIDQRWIPILYAGFNIIYAVLAPFAGNMEDKYGKQRVITIGLSILVVISGILSIPIPRSTFSIVLIIIIFLVFGVYMAIVDTGSRAFISDITGKNKKGKIYGMYYLLVGILSIPESLLFAFFYDFYGFQTAFLFSTITLIICVIVFAKANFRIAEQ